MLLLCFKRRLQTNQNRTHGPLLRICAGYASFQEVLFMSKSHRSKSVAAVLAAVLALGMVPSAAFGVPAGAAADDVPDSWRYDKGEWIFAEPEPQGDVMVLSYQEGWNWPKIEGGYQSNDGNVVNAVKRGMDVSYWQGLINWERAKADGIDFAILRCGYVKTLGRPQVDQQWKRNAQECERLGIPYGVYIYSYAKTVEAAKAEADHVINTLKGFSPTYPVYFDLEEKSLEGTSNRMLLANMASAFCDKIAAAGYTPGIYANTNWWNNYLTDPVFDQWERWVAQYNSKCSYTRGSYRLWQCSASGKVDGIVGNVDLDLEFDGAFASNPVRKTWVKVGSNWYLRDSGGNNLIGWQVVNGQRYYLAASGVMQTGWVSYEGSWYYLSGSGAMKTGWARSGGKWYYLDPSSGRMLTGWQTVDGKRYYLTPGNGAMVTGTQTIGGVTYRFDDSGALIEGGAGNANTGASASGVSGWVSSGGHWYLKDSSGRNLTGWQKVRGTWYYMDASGVMLTGWQKVGGTWYYLKGSGAMATGWQKLGGTWYYLKSSGAMAKGWYKVGGKWYYSNSSGAMQANRWIGNYYVTGSGAMATSAWIGRYHVNASGLWDKTR